MKCVALALLTLAASFVYAEEEKPSAAPEAQAAGAATAKEPAAEPKPEAEKAAEPKAEKPEPAQIEAKAEEKKAEEKKPAFGANAEPKAAKASEKKHLTPEELRDAEWRFLKAAVEEKNSDSLEAVIADVEVFARSHPDASMAAEAQAYLASLYQKKGDWRSALVALLHLLHEFPSSKSSLQSKSTYLDLSAAKLSRKLKGPAGELLRTPEGKEASDRLAGLIEKLSGELADPLYEPAVAEARRFSVRFPDYPQSDRVQWALAQMHEKAEKWAAALLSYRKLLDVYPDSAFRPKAQFAVGGLYAERLKEYKKAIDAYQEVVAQYPGAPEVLPALERTAELFADRLKQYELAVEMHEKIIALAPKTEAALKAFLSAAKLQRDRLEKPAEAIKTLKRLSAQFGVPAGVEALQNAATIARKDLKDYAVEIELRKQLAADFSQSAQAPEELYSVAEIYEGDLKDNAKAIAAYKDVAAKFPQSKAGKKAAERATKLESKKG